MYREDVVEAILRAGLDSQAPTGRFDLPGVDKEFVRVVNGGDVRFRHVPSVLARALGHAMPGLTPALVDVLLSDSVAEPGRVERAFGLGERRRVGDIYPRRLPVAA